MSDLYIEILRSGLKKRAGQPWACSGHPHGLRVDPADKSWTPACAGMTRTMRQRVGFDGGWYNRSGYYNTVALRQSFIAVLTRSVEGNG